MVRSRPARAIRACPIGKPSSGKFVGLEMVIKIFVFAVNDRVIDRHRFDQHRVSVLHRRRRHHDEPGIMRVKRFHRLAVKRPASLCSAGRQTHGDRHRHVCAPIMRAGVVENLVERDAGEIRELHFDNRPHSLHRSADGSADHRIFADRRVQDAPGKFLRQTFRGFERAAECPADILSVNEDAIIVAQQFCLRFADRFEISDAHGCEMRMSNRMKRRMTNRCAMLRFDIRICFIRHSASSSTSVIDKFARG